jgi:hypothetical protein
MPRVATEPTLTMAPFKFSIISGSTAWQHQSVGHNERWISAVICSGV